jgi:hypothetical protein
MRQDVHVDHRISNIAASLGILRLRSDTQEFHGSLSGYSAFRPAIRLKRLSGLRSAASTIVHCPFL